jgi:hypothetical protein
MYNREPHFEEDIFLCIGFYVGIIEPVSSAWSLCVLDRNPFGGRHSGNAWFHQLAKNRGGKDNAQGNTKKTTVKKAHLDVFRELIDQR